MRRTETLSYTTQTSCVIFPASVLLDSTKKKQFMFTKRRRKVFTIRSRKRFSTSRRISTNTFIANTTLVQSDYKYDETDPEQTHSNALLWTGSKPTQLNMQIYQYSNRWINVAPVLISGTVDHVQCWNMVNWSKCVQSVNIQGLINLVHVKVNSSPRVGNLLAVGT